MRQVVDPKISNIQNFLVFSLAGVLLPDVMAVSSENSLNIPTVHLTVELVLIAWTPLCSEMIYLTKKIGIHLEMKPRFPKKTSETFDVMRCLV